MPSAEVSKGAISTPVIVERVVRREGMTDAETLKTYLCNPKGPLRPEVKQKREEVQLKSRMVL